MAPARGEPAGAESGVPEPGVPVARLGLVEREVWVPARRELAPRARDAAPATAAAA